MFQLSGLANTLSGLTIRQWDGTNLLVLYALYLVPCTAVDSAVGYFFCVDVNLDRFIFRQGGLDIGPSSLRESASVWVSVDTPLHSMK